MNMPEDRIDMLLLEQSHHVADDGFTMRVIGQLPQRRIMFRPLVMFGAVSVGAVLLLRWLPLEQLPPLTSTILSSPDLNVLLPWAILLLVSASLAWGAVSAVQRED